MTRRQEFYLLILGGIVLGFLALVCLLAKYL